MHAYTVDSVTVLLGQTLLTIWRESQLSADYSGTLVVPIVVTHSTIPASNTHFHSTQSEFIINECISSRVSVVLLW